GSISNTASVAVPTGFTDPTPGNNTSSAATTTINRQADLSITKSAAASVIAGQNLTYTITVTNNGPSSILPADQFTVSDYLPGGYTATSFTPSSGVYDQATGNWSGVSMTNGQSVTLSISGIVNAGITGTLTNTATVAPNGIPDPDYSNNTTANVNTTTSKQTDLSVSKVVDNLTPDINSDVTFTITAKNNGTSNATGVTVNDILPSGYTFVSISSTKGSWTDPTWNIGNLLSGESETLSLIATVNGTGIYTNTATITGSQTDPNMGNNSATCTPVPKPFIGISNPTVNEGSNEVFTISLSIPSSTPVIFTPVLTSVTATIGTDTGTPIQYSIDGGNTWTIWASGSISIPAGITSIKISVPTIDDNIAEPTETFNLSANITSGNTTNVSETGTATILDNDVTTISVSSPTVTEGADEVFSITLSNPSSTPVNFTPSLTSITATVGIDTGTPIQYSIDGGNTWTTWISGNISIPAGITVLKICIPTIDDNIVEPTETFSLTTTVTSGNTTNGSASGIGTIIDNDAATLALTGFTVTETDGSQTQNFIAKIDKPAAKDIVLSFNTTDGTALAGSDYTAQAGTVVTIPAGSTSVNIPVVILGDLIAEPTETFTGTVTLTNANGQTVTLGTTTATATIIDNDALNVSINDVTVNENAGTATFTVTLGGSTENSVSVDFATADNTALAGSDYTTTSGTVTFPAGSVSGTTKNITVPILDDNIVEPTETFFVNLSNLVSSSTATISDNQGIGTIIDNDAIASNDIITTNEDTPIKINVLANDTFAPDDIVKVTDVSTPANGSVVINPDGTVTYTPAPDFNGTDTFTYTVTVTNPDGTKTTETATVTVNVTPVPDVKDDTVTTPEDTSVTISVLANDTFKGTNHALTGVTQPANGSVVINPDGTVTYKPNLNFNGTDTFTYTVTVTNPDGTKTTETATVTVNVTPVNDPPVGNDVHITTPEDTPFSGKITATDVDGDILTYKKGTDPTNGTVVVNPDGTYIYTPNLNYNGNDIFTVTVDDGNGGVITITVYVTVTPVNDAPVAIDDVYTTLEDKSLSGNTLTNDTDADGDKLTLINFTVNGVTNLAGTNANLPNVGNIEINSDGTFIFTPAANYYGTVPTITYTVSDGSLTDTANVLITVLPLPEVYKSSSKPMMNNDGTFKWIYTIKLVNDTNHDIDSIQVEDNLDDVFKSKGCTYTVTSITASGKLVGNGLYNGSSYIGTLIDGGKLKANETDSIMIEVKVDTQGQTDSISVYNQADFTGIIYAAKVSILSDDVSIIGTQNPTKTVIPEANLFIPDAFSPNGDGFNDKFVIIHPAQMKIEFEVFNRWDNKVYSNKNYQNDWDGKGTNNFLGQDLPNGTYYCTYKAINSKNGTIIAQGVKYITLRR
ncbi:MAG: Ig-like domain-containing protein, partial [Paludibacter sp.]|nr:Ig-like domain-containing protein [Paludibacter sp.]